MRRIVKPPAPALEHPSYDGYARALGNIETVGRFCSFCEKALNQRLLLFHKKLGVVPAAASLSDTDWADLLLICDDCAVNATTFDPRAVYYWPDEPDAIKVPFRYPLVDGVKLNAQGPEGGVIATATARFVLVGIADDIEPTLMKAAGLTLHLFKLNGRFFNNDVASPAYDLSYDEYVHPSDYRVAQRSDAYNRASRIAKSLAESLSDPDVSREQICGQLALMADAIAGFGFFSTWEMAVDTTLAAITPDPRPTLIQIMTQKPREPLPDRKRRYEALQNGVADDVVVKKRLLHRGRLVQLIKA